MNYYRIAYAIIAWSFLIWLYVSNNAITVRLIYTVVATAQIAWLVTVRFVLYLPQNHPDIFLVVIPWMIIFLLVKK